MESVGRLAGGVAHDFNNMLAVILGRTELALRRVDRALPLYQDLEEIRTAARRSADLTRQLLAFARGQTAVTTVLDLNETVAGMLTMLQRLIGENVRLLWVPDPDLGRVRLDPSQVDQILVNLCVNARDSIAGVGTVTVETGNSTLDEHDCSGHPGCTPGAYLWIVVSDDGCGMDEETLAHIFEPFFTTKGIGQGTGLGLATVYGIVKQNNGFISVDSAPNKGTTFTIYLPEHKAGLDVSEEIVGPVVLPRSGHETILIVEDEPAVLRLTSMMLEEIGYVVLAAGTAGEAVRLAHKHSDEIQLLLTDLLMPEMNGRDLATRLLAAQPSLKCLFMSGYPAEVVADRDVAEGGMNFLQKPFSTEALAAKVREVLDGKPSN
jgi:CheY-like chemotaxis protein